VIARGGPDVVAYGGPLFADVTGDGGERTGDRIQLGNWRWPATLLPAAVTTDLGRLEGLARDLAPDLVGRFAALASTVAPEVFAQLAPVPPETGVIALALRPCIDPAAVLAGPGPAPLVLLESPTHAGNLGAVVRVAAAAGAAGVLTTGRLDPWQPAALRGSAGLHFALPVARIEALPASDRPLIALDPEGEPFAPGLVPERAILAFGSERRGLGRDLLDRADARLALPMRAGVSSLNLATAVAVALYVQRLGGR